MKFIHSLSKPARTRIVALMLRSRSVSELAAEIGVSPAAVSKYLSGKTHPSDDTMARMFSAMTEDELCEALTIAIEDLLESLASALIEARNRGFDVAGDPRIAELAAEVAKVADELIAAHRSKHMQALYEQYADIQLR